jgi:hypothetical protein
MRLSGICQIEIDGFRSFQVGHFNRIGNLAVKIMLLLQEIVATRGAQQIKQNCDQEGFYRVFE